MAGRPLQWKNDARKDRVAQVATSELCEERCLNSHHFEEGKVQRIDFRHVPGKVWCLDLGHVLGRQSPGGQHRKFKGSLRGGLGMRKQGGGKGRGEEKYWKESVGVQQKILPGEGKWAWCVPLVI